MTPKRDEGISVQGYLTSFAGLPRVAGQIERVEPQSPIEVPGERDPRGINADGEKLVLPGFAAELLDVGFRRVGAQDGMVDELRDIEFRFGSYRGRAPLRGEKFLDALRDFFLVTGRGGAHAFISNAAEQRGLVCSDFDWALLNCIDE